MKKSNDHKWQRLQLADLALLLSSAPAPWWVAGGLAIDLFLNRDTRSHEDLDIVINRADQKVFIHLLEGWDLRAAQPSGILKSLDGESASLDVSGVWCRENEAAPWRFEFLLSSFSADEWIYRRNPRIRGPIESFGWQTADGLRVISPEIQLLYKSKAMRSKDEFDFQNCMATLNRRQLSWLAEALSIEHGPDHPWLRRIKNS